MTNTNKILKEAKQSGQKISSEIKTSLRAIEKLHELSNKCKISPSKVYEQTHHSTKKHYL